MPVTAEKRPPPYYPPVATPEVHVVDLALATVACLIVVMVPGVALALGLRLRGLWLFAASFPLGVTAVAAAAVLTGVLGITWAMWSVLVIAAAGGGVLWILTARWRALRPRSSFASRGAWIGLSVAVGVALLLVRVGYGIADPALFAQAFDNVFHLNAVRWIVDTGDASPINVAQLSAPGSSTNYPSAWHAVGALIIQLTGVSIPVSSNAALIVFGCIAWPAGVVLVTRALFGASRSLLVAAGALSAAFGPFPLMLIPYLGTFPLVLSTAIMPALLAAAVEVGGFRIRTLGTPAALVLLAIAVPGLALSHPSSLVTLPILALPVAVAVAVRVWRLSAGASARRVAVLALLAYCMATLALIVFVRPSNDSPSPARGTLGQGIGEAVTSTMGGQPLSIGVAVLVVAGALMAARSAGPKRRVASGMWLMGAALYAVTAGAPEFWRLLVAGPWYLDSFRVAAAVTVACVPVSAYAASTIWKHVRLRIHRRLPRPKRWLRASAAIVGGTALLVVSNGAGAWAVAERTRTVYLPADDALIAVVSLNTNARNLIARIPEIVPRGELIANNPWDGSGFVYALTDRPVLFPHQLAVRGQAGVDFLDGFALAGTDDPACAAVRDLDVRWVIDLDPEGDRVRPTAPKFPGMAELSDSPNVEEAARVGDATLYRVTGCRLG